MGTVYIFRGKAATGKTTLSNMLAEKLSIPVLRKDDIIDALKSSAISDRNIVNEICYNILYDILKSEGNLTMSGRFCERPAGYATQMQRNTGTSLDMRARRGCERNGKKRREKKRAASGSITSPGRRPSCFLMSGCQTSLPVQK